MKNHTIRIIMKKEKMANERRCKVRKRERKNEIPRHYIEYSSAYTHI